MVAAEKKTKYPQYFPKYSQKSISTKYFVELCRDVFLRGTFPLPLWFFEFGGEFGKWVILRFLHLTISPFLFSIEYCLLLNIDTPHKC